MKVKILVKKLGNDVKDLSYAHKGDSGVDLYANESLTIMPMETKLVGTGIQISMPGGYEAQVRPKSGLAASRGITVLNTPGTVDSCYRGEIKVILINLSNKPYQVEKGKKIAQLVFAKVEEAEFGVVSELEDTARKAGGFGSTGLN